MISIQNLSFRFADRTQADTPARASALQPALRNVNLTVDDGEFVVITGPSGCGKSTLALAMGGFLFQRYEGKVEGEVFVSGADGGPPLDARHTPLYEVADIVGLVQQNPEAQFCTLTVRDEVAFGLENRCLPRETIRARMRWALDIVGAAHLEDRALATLSGGEKQKIAIAAMMAAKPEILIFDEPTSNLDPTATAEIFDVIARIRAEAPITVIVIEHKLDYLRRFERGGLSRLVKMEEGRIVYDGPIAARSCSQDVSDRGCGRVSVGDLVQPEGTPVVRVEHLDIGYNGVLVLRDISLEIAQGEFVAIMGDNGSGKTTFLQSLLGLRQPDGGRVEVLGQDIGKTPTSQLARQVGFVFQNPDHQLFADCVWEEAIFAPRNFGVLDARLRAETEHLLARCGLENRHRDHPYHLSYGEKRRLNVISVLTYNPRLILLDEVLIGQDAENADFLMGLLRGHVDRGGTVLMVNHNSEITQRYASRLIFFEQGQVSVNAPTQKAFEHLAALGRWVYVPTVAQHLDVFPSSPLCHSRCREESLLQILGPRRCGSVVAGPEREAL